MFTEIDKAVLSGQLELLKYGLVTEAQQLASMGIKKHNLDEDEIKKSDKDKGAEEQSLMQQALEIEQMVREFKENNGICEDQAPTRCVESLRQTCTKEYLKKLVGAGKCKRCKGGWQNMVFYKSRIVFSLRRSTVSSHQIGYISQLHLMTVDSLLQLMFEMSV